MRYAASSWNSAGPDVVTVVISPIVAHKKKKRWCLTIIIIKVRVVFLDKKKGKKENHFEVENLSIHACHPPGMDGGRRARKGNPSWGHNFIYFIHLHQKKEREKTKTTGLVNTYGIVTGKSGPSSLEPSQKQSNGVMMAQGKIFSKI